MPRTPQETTAAIIANLPAKTGRTLEEWIDLVKTKGPAGFKDRVAWLKAEYQLGHGTAQTIAGQVERPADYVERTSEQMLEAQYAGPKAAPWPIYERLVQLVAGLGDAALIEPRQTYVAFTRWRQFGLIQASTKSRADLGLILPDIERVGRLQAAGSFGSGRITHRVALYRAEDVDDQVAGWLRAAYLADGG